MSIDRRLRELERRFGQTNDQRFLAVLCRAVQGDAEARSQLERICAAGGTGTSRLVEIGQLYLDGPVMGVTQ